MQIIQYFVLGLLFVRPQTLRGKAEKEKNIYFLLLEFCTIKNFAYICTTLLRR